MSGLSEQYDIIVVGAGPAGSAAAKTAADLGYKTLLLEKAPLTPNGRYKPCGGAMDAELVSFLKLPDEIIERHVESLVLHHIGRQTFEKPGKGAVVWRSKFDKYLVDVAAHSGAVVKDSEPLIAIVPLMDKDDEKAGDLDAYHYSIKTPKTTYLGKYVIAADGVTSKTLRILGWPAFEAEDLVLTITKEMRSSEESIKKHLGDDKIHLYFGKELIPMGYGWLFPKKEIISVGWGNRIPEIVDTKKEFSRFTSLEHIKNAIDGAVPVTYMPHLIPVGERKQLYGDFVFAAGDAGGLVDPISGKGIPYALLSGSLAVKAISAAEKKDDAGSLGNLYLSFMEESFLKKLRGKKALRDRVFKSDDSLFKFLELWKKYRGSEILAKKLM